MNKLIQIKLPAHEKLVLDQIAKSEGFRSTASFAYYAIKQQVKRIKKDNDERLRNENEEMDKKLKFKKIS